MERNQTFENLNFIISYFSPSKSLGVCFSVKVMKVQYIAVCVCGGVLLAPSLHISFISTTLMLLSLTALSGKGIDLFELDVWSLTYLDLRSAVSVACLMRSEVCF